MPQRDLADKPPSGGVLTSEPEGRSVPTSAGRRPERAARREAPR